MKKILFTMVFVLSIFVVLSCESMGEFTSQEEVNTAFQRVYNEYRRDIILDGAGNFTVSFGDTLSAISRKQYDNGYYFPLIMLASSEIVLDPDRIESGMKLTIPNLEKNLNDDMAKTRLKYFFEEIAVIYDRRGRPSDANGLRELAATIQVEIKQSE